MTLKGSNFYKNAAVVDGRESSCNQSAVATPADNGMESGIYLGILGFNSALYEYPVMRLDKATVGGFYDFVDGLQAKDMTLLYYSVEKAIEKLQRTALPSDLSKVALVTFTDGLDRGSHGKTDAYIDSEDGNLDYRNDLNELIHTQTVAGKEISAYCIGLKGDDVGNKDEIFMDNLRSLSSEDGNAVKVNDMSEVNAKFKDIAAKLTTSTSIQSFTCKIPPEANGTDIRFTFDNTEENAENSKVWIQGTFNLRTKALDNIKYKGLNFNIIPSSVAGSVDEEGFCIYNFEGIITDNYMILSPAAINEYIY